MREKIKYSIQGTANATNKKSVNTNAQSKNVGVHYLGAIQVQLICIKQCPSNPGFLNMAPVFTCLVLLLLPPWCLAQTASNTVNERIPVQPAQLEKHWRVNCEQSWATLLATANNTDHCTPEPELLRQLRLCSFIYQPPGGGLNTHCPDYRGATSALEKAVLAGDCRRLATYVGGLSGCPANTEAQDLEPHQRRQP